ncbi:MAG: dienelactone hydrolase family protein, partial [Acidimicrobiales bacterium]
MIEAEVALTTNDGYMGAFTTRPDEGGPFPTVFFYMDAPGKREELHDMARRIATTGYYVILPNLYYRERAEFELDFDSEDSRKEMFDLMYGLGNRMVVEDTGSM